MLTPEHAALRRLTIGSSDMAAILGMNPWAGPMDVYLEKTGQLIDERTESKAAEAGSFLEAGVMDWAESELGPLERKVNVRHPDPEIPLASSLDARVRSCGSPVEGKTAGLFSPLSRDWGASGTDEIPEYQVVQCHVHMAVTRTEICYVPAFLGGRGFMMFVVRWDPEMRDAIEMEARVFWRYVEMGVPPGDEWPYSRATSSDSLRRLIRTTGKQVPVPVHVIDEWLLAVEGRKSAARFEDECKTRLLEAMGDAEESAPTDVGRVTYREQSRKGGIDEDRLRAEMPDVYRKFLKPATTYRVLRHSTK